MTALEPLYLRSADLEAEAGAYRRAGLLSDADLLLVDQVAPRFAPDAQPQVLLGLALALAAQRSGHAGVDLLSVEDRWREARAGVDGASDEASDKVDEPAPDPRFPQPGAWLDAVVNSALVGDAEQADRPFMAQRGVDLAGTTLVMSRRMWSDQERLAEGIAQVVGATPSPLAEASAVEAGIATLFGKEAHGEGADAVRVAAQRSLCVVTGGPGTGKTYSIKRLLALLLQLNDAAGGPPLRIEMAAPTGKAAVRMTEAMAEELDELHASDAVKSTLRALPARTLHKLLRVRPDGTCGVSPTDRLDADVVVVDEASMVDLTMMRRLFEGIAPGTRLVLLGDRDQLASVEAGTVLADMVSGAFAGEDGLLSGAVARFTHSHRFKSAPTVGALARTLQVREGPWLEQAMGFMSGNALGEGEKLADRVRWLGPEPKNGRPDVELLAQLAKPYTGRDDDLNIEGYAALIARRLREGGLRALRQPATQAAVVLALDSYRVLAVHRRGPLGVSGLNRSLSALVQKAIVKGMKERPGASEDAAAKRGSELPKQSGLWLGQPVLVTENAYDVDLRNGDVGVVLPSRTSGRLCVVFPVGAVTKAADGIKTVETREVDIARLPAHETALAMTVHKSQGSQFDIVALVLAHEASAIQTRELIYTGITRAKSRLNWVGTEAQLRAGLDRAVGRASGLGALLWGRQGRVGS